MTTEPRKFHLGDILSVTGRAMVSPRGLVGIKELVAYMEGHMSATHELPDAADRCIPALLEAMPWLAQIDDSSVNEHNVYDWMRQQVDIYGEWHEVPTARHQREISALESLQAAMDDKPVFGIVAKREE